MNGLPERRHEIGGAPVFRGDGRDEERGLPILADEFLVIRVEVRQHPGDVVLAGGATGEGVEQRAVGGAVDRDGAAEGDGEVVTDRLRELVPDHLGGEARVGALNGLALDLEDFVDGGGTWQGEYRRHDPE